ncbi:MAG: tetratricopeptide repeat protein, partial [Bryobacteraceae bacterium]
MTPAAILLLLLFGQARNAETISQEALEMAQQKRFAEAERLWKQALALSPNLFSAAFNLGFMFHSQGEYAKAEPYLARAARAAPEDFNAKYLLGATLLQLGRSEDALRQWRAALALRPDHFKLMQMMAIEYGKGRYFAEAAAIAERALGLKDDDPDVYLIAIRAYQDAADHPAALKVAERMARKFPDLPRANFEYGYELHRSGRASEGLPYLKRAMEADQTYEEPFFFYGEILLSQRRFEEAIPPLQRSIELKPDYMAAWVALGRALMGLRRYEDAKTELLRAIEINPRHPQPRLLLSQIYFRMGDEEHASQEKELSLKLRRENPQAMESPQARPFPS